MKFLIHIATVPITALLLGSFIATTGMVVTMVSAQLECGPTNGSFHIAGSRAVEPIAKSWAEGYMAKCPSITVNVSTGGDSNSGARRVCNDTSMNGGESAVEIGMMSREWNLNMEVNVTDKAQEKYACNIGTQGRNVTQIDVAIDSLVFILINGGLAAQCLRKLDGDGLSIDQLRWIYSNYTTAQLLISGWDPSGITKDDNSETSHKWSEISDLCPNTEIKLSSPTSLSYKYEFFKEIVFPNQTEGFATKRPFGILQSDNEREIIEFVLTSSAEVYGDAIGFVGFLNFQAEFPNLYGIPIRAKGSTIWIIPNKTSIEASTYTPFSRRLFMNVLDASLVTTGPFISYGLNAEGIDRVETLGYLPPPVNERAAILARIGQDPPPTLSPVITSAPTKKPTWAPFKLPTLRPIKRPTLKPTRAPTNKPTRAPTKKPTLAPTKIPTKPPTRPPCGLFGLSIFCPCGVIGRLFRLCGLK